MKKHCTLALGLALIIGMSGQVSAALIAHWTFETSVPTSAGPHVAELGIQAGTAAATGFHAGTTTYSNPAGNGSPESFSSNGWTTIGDYYQFQVNLTGFTNATVEWQQARSSTGPAEFDLQFSTDGVNFSSLGFYGVAVSTSPTAWNSTTFNSGYGFGPTSLTAAVDNQPTVFVRMSSRVTAASTGTNRIDDVIVRAVPEPSALTLIGGAFFGMSFFRKRK